MATDVVLEAASEGMEFAAVSRWYVEEGGEVTEAEPLLEVEADKATYDIPAPVSGRLVEVLAVAGDEVAVGDTLGTIEPA